MRFVPAAELKPGMITTKPIYQRGILILAANHTLKQDTINAIRRSDLQGLYIYDEFSNFEQLNLILDDNLRYQMVREMRDFNIDQVVYLSNQIVDSVLAMGDKALVDLNELMVYDEDTYHHSMDVSLLSTTCGVAMGLNNAELKNLALAAALHDIGKRLIPKRILNKKEALTEEEREIIRNHPRAGYDLLYNNSSISAFVRSAILSHHENWDGSGYPKKLKGEAIPRFGMIIHVADVYDALIRKRPYKDQFAQSEAIEYLKENRNILFDSRVVQAFLDNLVVYPVGSTVTLSDGRVARVVQNRRAHIMRPVVVTVDYQVYIDLGKDTRYKDITIVEADDPGNQVEREVCI